MLACLVQEQLHFNGQEDAHQRALYEERSVYCMGLPPLWTSTQVGDFFGQQGDVEDVYLWEPKPWWLLVQALKKIASQKKSHLLCACPGANCNRTPRGSCQLTSQQRRAPKMQPYCMTGRTLVDNMIWTYFAKLCWTCLHLGARKGGNPRGRQNIRSCLQHQIQGRAGRGSLGFDGLTSMDTGAGARNSWKSFFFSGTSTRAGHQSALDPEGFLVLWLTFWVIVNHCYYCMSHR